MPFLDVYYGDEFHYSAEVVEPSQWWMYASMREVTAEEYVEFQRLMVEHQKLQDLLKKVHARQKMDAGENADGDIVFSPEE